MFSLVPPTHYAIVYSFILLILVVATCLAKYQQNTALILQGNPSQIYGALALCVFVILYFGLRPYQYILSDTLGYAGYFNSGDFSKGIEEGSENMWAYFLLFLYSLGFSVEAFIFIVAFLYVVLHFIVCKRWYKNNEYISFLFCITAFSFYAYGTNTIRCGLAAAILLYSISIFPSNLKKGVFRIIIFSILAYISIRIHNAMTISLVAFLLAAFIVKNFKVALAIWFICIMVSLLSGNGLSDIITNYEWDDPRINRYVEGGQDLYEMQQNFSRVGFRWDFLIYSAVPIFIGYFTIIKRQISNNLYLVLLNTYILANSFWILVIRSQQSDRFAYTSWFIYAFVLSYPLLKFKISQNQNIIFCILLLFLMGIKMLLSF